jgi:putative ABC transport system ATP-binding protein
MTTLNEELGTTFVFATHDQRLIERARRLIRLVDGGVESDTRRPTTKGA